ncbi:hypothetical protein BpHYR1_002493 [Brachionus plicatilis]|uniref:Uncharacterized protein n=1 Tax=Brachionus plicatilis TaxID=10195 RepID=A0A3M7RMR7_BRAPC|nr:hypothetical protein BpHYR1_002493 [Brachionus plicatilis]
MAFLSRKNAIVAKTIVPTSLCELEDSVHQPQLSNRFKFIFKVLANGNDQLEETIQIQTLVSDASEFKLFKSHKSQVKNTDQKKVSILLANRFLVDGIYREDTFCVVNLKENSKFKHQSSTQILISFNFDEDYSRKNAKKMFFKLSENYLISTLNMHSVFVKI